MKAPEALEGWSEARPRGAVEPTYYPAALALGIILSLCGLLTGWIVLAAGLVVSLFGAAGWVGEILRAAREREEGGDTT